MRTYGSRARQNKTPNHEILDSVKSSRKRPLQDAHSNTPFAKRPRTAQPTVTETQKLKQKSLTQLHFCIDQTTLRTCPLCDLSYTKGALDDETLHRTHCNRVRKGIEWGRDEVKEGFQDVITEVKRRMKLKDGRTGRIISFPADVGGKIGTKLSALLHTINLSLSAPSLTQSAVQSSKAYLFLLPQETNTKREQIIGCLIAQRISTAMEIVRDEEVDAIQPNNSNLVSVDCSTGLFCHSEPLPTPLGISRLFVSSKHRRQGVARALLSATAETFIYGCPLDPSRGQVAFTQPTGDGRMVMHGWGGSRMRIYED